MSAAFRDIEAFVLVALAAALIFLRTYVRVDLVGLKKLKLDDYLMLLTGALFISETTLAYLVVAKYDGLTNSYMTDEARAALDPSSTEYYKRVMGSKIQVLGWSLYVMTLWLGKFCLAIFFSRLTTGLMQFENRVRIAYILLGVTYLATALSIVLSCRPMPRFWQINPDPGNTCQPTVSKVYILVAVVLNVFTDVFLLFIPLPLLWKVEIGLKKKISLMVLFSGGIFIIAASIIRAAVILSSSSDGAVKGSKWACRETFVSIAVANLPIIFPFIRSCANKIGLSALFSSSGRPSNSHPLSSKRATGHHELRSRSTKHHHPLSMPGGTAWDSDEHILVNNNHVHVSSNTFENGARKSDDNDKPKGGIGITKEVTIVQETAPSP